MSRHPDSGGRPCELPSRDSPLSADRRLHPPRAPRRGERIPSEHALCAKFKVSRPTVRQALDVLVQEGRLYRHAGRGTFATAAAGGDRRLRVIGSIDDMMALGDETWFKLVSREVVLRCRPTSPRRSGCRRAPRAYRDRRRASRRDGPVPARHRVAAASRSARRSSDEDLSKTLAARRHRAPARACRSSSWSRRSTPRWPRATVAELLAAPRPHAAAAASSAPTSRRAASRSSTPSPTRRAGAIRTASSSPGPSAGADRAWRTASASTSAARSPTSSCRRPSGELHHRQAADDVSRSLRGLPGRSRRADGAARGVSWADAGAGRARHDARLQRRHRAQGARASACSRRAASATCSSSAARSATRSTTSRSRSRAPLIPRRLIGEVTERVLADGSVRDAARRGRRARARSASSSARGVTTLAVCLLHAYLNPAHEQRAGRARGRGGAATWRSRSRTRCRRRSASTSARRRPSSTPT